MTYLPVDILIDQKTKQRHKIDSLNLLAYVSLLVLVLVTTWFFKRRANKSYLHETGLAIIYGFIMGAGLRYFGVELSVQSRRLLDPIPAAAPSDYVIISAHILGDKNISAFHEFAYEFRGEIKQNTKLGTQISYASVDPEVFFNIILPPIVLNAGLSLKRKHFFRNIGAIFSYAFIGTTISVATVGSIIFGLVQAIKIVFNDPYLADQFSLSNCFYFGAIISPTDPLAVLAIFQELGVDLNLFALVFGESILNDAVSIVLTHTIDQFGVIYRRSSYYSFLRIIWQCFSDFTTMFFGSCCLGILFGIVTSLTTKFTKLTESPLLETSLVILMSYCSFLTAEVLDTSGIVAILMCGITQAHYTINNLSFEARERLKNLFELLTFLCESFLFLAVGVCFWQRGQTWNMPFIGIAFVAITVARALSVYPVTVLLNLGRRRKIPMNYQHLITWGGAARGVISYSLAARNTVGDARRIMLSTTSVIVIVTVISVGAIVCPLLKWLNIPYGPNKSTKQRQDGSDQGNNQPAILGKHDQSGGVYCNDGDEEEGEQEMAYHGTNNPAWLVRPKRLHSFPSCPMCCYHAQFHHQLTNESVLVVGNETSIPSTPRTLSNGLIQRRGVHHHHHHQNVCALDRARLYDRCPRMSDHSTPVLEIDTGPNLSVAKGADKSLVVWGKLNRCNCTTESKTLATSSVSTTSGNLHSAHADGSNCEPASHEGDTLPPPIGEEKGRLSGSCSGQTSVVPSIEGSSQSVSAQQQPGGEIIASSSIDQLTGSTRPNDGPYQNASLVRRWRNIDNFFIKPLLTNSQPNLLETMPSGLRCFARLFTSDEQLMRQQHS